MRHLRPRNDFLAGASKPENGRKLGFRRSRFPIGIVVFLRLLVRSGQGTVEETVEFGSDRTG